MLSHSFLSPLFILFISLPLSQWNKRGIHTVQWNWNHLHFTTCQSFFFCCHVSVHHRESDKENTQKAVMKQGGDAVCILDFVHLKRDTWKCFGDPGTPLQVCVVRMQGCVCVCDRLIGLQGLLSQWTAGWKVDLDTKGASRWSTKQHNQVQK